MSPIDITIVNPFSPGLLIAAGIALVVLGLMTWLAIALQDPEPFGYGLVISFVFFALGAAIVFYHDVADRNARVVEELEALGYDHVAWIADEISAADPKGIYVTGIVQELDNEHYTIFFR